LYTEDARDPAGETRLVNDWSSSVVEIELPLSIFIEW
jgi:hypothetical protein